MSSGGTGKVGAYTTVLTSTPTIETSLYATGDLVGPKITLATAVRVQPTGKIVKNTAMIQSVVITDLDKESKNLDVVFFDTNPSNTTFTDNAAFDIHDTDLLTVIGVVVVDTWADFNDNSVGQALNLAMPFSLGSGTDLYAAIVARSGPTYTGTTDLTLRVGILFD